MVKFRRNQIASLRRRIYELPPLPLTFTDASFSDSTHDDLFDFEGFTEADKAVNALESLLSWMRESIGDPEEGSESNGSVGTSDVSLIWDDLSDKFVMEDLPSAPCTRSMDIVPEIEPLPKRPLEYKK